MVLHANIISGTAVLDNLSEFWLIISILGFHAAIFSGVQHAKLGYLSNTAANKKLKLIKYYLRHILPLLLSVYR